MVTVYMKKENPNRLNLFNMPQECDQCEKMVMLHAINPTDGECVGSFGPYKVNGVDVDNDILSINVPLPTQDGETDDALTL